MKLVRFNKYIVLENEFEKISASIYIKLKMIAYIAKKSSAR